MSENAINEEAEWSRARECVKALGKPSDMLLLCSRAIMKNYALSGDANAPFDYPSLFLMRRLLKSSTFRAKIYFAAQALRPEVLSGYPKLGWDEFLALFPPTEYAAVISLIALHRQAKLACPGDEWTKLSYHLYASTDLGYMLGSSISKIGCITGMLVGSMRPISFCAFGKKNGAALKSYRKYLKLKTLPYDFTLEREQWGCTNSKISSLLMQNLGFGIEYTRRYSQAFDATPDDQLEAEAIPFRVAARWIDGLLLFDSPPTSALGDDYDISDHRLEALITKLDDIKKVHTQQHWLTRGSNDITAECPALLESEALIGVQKKVSKASEEVEKLKDHFDEDEMGVLSNDEPVMEE